MSINKIFMVLLACVLSVTLAEAKVMDGTSLKEQKAGSLNVKQNELQLFDSLKHCTRKVVNTREEIVLLNSMLRLAQQMDSTRMQCQVMAFMVRNYYNRMKPDSLMYWAGEVEKKALEYKYYTSFFDAYSFVCSWELYAKNYESALDKANRLYLMAKDLNNVDGMIASYETIGLIYLETFRYVEAIKAYKEGLRLQKQQTNPRYGYQFQFLSYIIEAYLKLKDYKSVEVYLEDGYALLEKCKSIEGNFPYDRCLWLLDCYHIEMYVAQKMPDKAKKHIEEAQKYKEVKDFYVFCYFHLVSASYYQLTGDYKRALENINMVLEQTDDEYLPALKVKAELLLESGKEKEAALLFHKSISLIDSTYNESLSKQINQLRTIHEVDKLELKNKELELESSSYKLKITIGLIIVLLLIMAAIIYHSIRMNRVKNQLEKSDKELKRDKERLLHSEKELSLAKEKAEISNHFKDVFLANMSHEVRTPLNAIVGFSSLLTELFEHEEEAKEYVGIIKYNSDLLLKLINDTVNISLLQTDQIPFVLEDCEINEYCQILIKEVEPKLASGVVLNFLPPFETFVLSTDVLRLRQVLVNLLMNAVKFTEKGEINFFYTVEEEKQLMHFIVEDTGKGIPKEMQEKIFESFEKVDVFTQGIGLGLTICKLVAHRLGGTITLDSTYEKGTRMIFTHPIRNK